MTNIIGDIAGQYDALIKLVDKMPKGVTISVGDMIDRGPKSKDVLDFFMSKKKKAIFGNHEHLMVDYLLDGKYYDRNTWFYNGGMATIKSFLSEEEFMNKRNLDDCIPQKYIDWINSLPKYIEKRGVLISHSFLPNYDMKDKELLEHSCDLGSCIWSKEETTIIWNRTEPVRRKKWKLQVAGHNSQFGFREWSDEKGIYAVCLDGSRHKMLTGLHLESMRIYQQNYE